MDIHTLVQRNVSLAPYTTFHIGGPADYFIKALTTDEIREAISWAKDKKIPFFVLGQGANILVGDKGFRGLVIKNEAKKILHIADAHITVEAGITIGELIEKTVALGLSGIEHFAGIPSSLGGALWQNLHFLAPDRSSTVFIGDIVEEAVLVQVTNNQSSIITVASDYFHFGYDYSVLHDTHDIVLSATLRLEKKPIQAMQQVIDANLAWRKAKHPKDATTKSAGSIFKKIEGYGAGRLIDQVGLKGKVIGGAQIAPEHANFIINTGNATAQDVRDLISLSQEKVKKVTGLSLEPEISFVGEF